jgi:hypothetical protein
VPDEKLTSRINYTGKLDLKAISEDFDDIDVDLKFYVEGRELISFVGDLELENPSSPNKLVYRGKVDFLSVPRWKKYKKRQALRPMTSTGIRRLTDHLVL